MTTKALEKTVKKLSSEVLTLRRFVIESAQNDDPEGAYKASFIKDTLHASKEPAIFSYSGKGSLLRKLRRS